MGKFIIYAAGVIMVVGVIIQNFVYEFQHYIYVLFLGACILMAVLGYFIDKKKNKKG